MNARRNLGRVSFLIAALLAPTSTAWGSEIVGKVVLSGQPTADVVVSIEDLKLEGPPDPKVYVIDHRNLNFVPRLLVVRPGARVRFENSDGMPCHIYSISPAGTFVLRGQDGKPVTITFDRPGVIEVRCSQHSRIDAFIFVKENPYFALSDAKGRYKILKVPPGRYTLRAWYEGRVVETRTIDLGTAKLKLDFKAPRPQPRALEAQPLDSASVVSAPAFLPGVFPELLTFWRKE